MLTKTTKHSKDVTVSIPKLNLDTVKLITYCVISQAFAFIALSTLRIDEDLFPYYAGEC